MRVRIICMIGRDRIKVAGGAGVWRVLRRELKATLLDPLLQQGVERAMRIAGPHSTPVPALKILTQAPHHEGAKGALIADGLCPARKRSLQQRLPAVRVRSHFHPFKVRSARYSSGSRSIRAIITAEWLSVVFLKIEVSMLASAQIAAVRLVRRRRSCVTASASSGEREERPRRRLFESLDFEVLRQIGSLSIQQSPIVPSLDRSPDEPSPELDKPSEQIKLYVARYKSGLPNEPEAQVILKECDASSEFAVRELRAFSELCASSSNDDPVSQLVSQVAQSGRKDESAGLLAQSDFTNFFAPWLSDNSPKDARMLASELPISPVLGSFQAAPMSNSVQSRTAVYIVQRWSSASVPLSVYLQLEQESFSPRLWPPIVRVKDTAWNMRRKFVRRVASQTLEALSLLHRSGVGHSALGLDSLLVSTADDRNYASVRVRIANFGVARCASSDDDCFEAMIDDCRGLAAAILALVLGAMSPSAADECPYSDEVQARRLLEARGGDVQELREFIAGFGQGVQRSVQLLDSGGGAGWQMIATLASESTATLAREEPEALQYALRWLEADADVRNER